MKIETQNKKRKNKKLRKHLNSSKILHQIGRKLKIFHSCVDQDFSKILQVFTFSNKLMDRLGNPPTATRSP